MSIFFYLSLCIFFVFFLFSIHKNDTLNSLLFALLLIIADVTLRCILSGLFGDIDLCLRLELILIRGFAQFNALSCLRHVVAPTLLVLCDLLLVPYFCARLACMFLSSYLLRTLLVRFSYHAYVALRVVTYLSYHLAAYLVKLHNEVRDSKYLIGTKLTNRA